jgi:DHA2 family multidrug resistance protein
MASIAATEAAAPVKNRGMITISIMLATIMTALDTTIANVALPHMAGSVSASADQITWVLTSYIVATAIMTPMTGWLAGRLGRKRVFVISIIGFTLSSALCGAATSLEQIVLFRVLQGIFGAAMMPLSQAVMLDLFTLEERGPAMAVWGMGVMVAPIVGPVLGGWLTDDFSWRWVFYINLPIGVVCLAGVLTFLHDDSEIVKKRFDITGFALLSILLAAFQLFLDRGENNDWFHSTETQLEAATAAIALILFFVHSTLAENPFIPLQLFRDRNFSAAALLGVAVGLLVFSVLALLPPMIETLLGYPVITTGLVTAPRGVGSLVSMFFVGRLVGKVDTRLIILTGLSMFALAFYQMSHFSLLMNAYLIATTGFIQGLGTGLVFMPMTTLAFATLAPQMRADGTGVFTLVRNLGNSAGISIMQAIFTSNTQIVHARLVQGLRPDNPAVIGGGGPGGGLPMPFSFTNPAGLAALNGEVGRQAAMIAYVDVFHLMFVTTLVMMPLLLLLKPASQAPAPGTSSVDH